MTDGVSLSRKFFCLYLSFFSHFSGVKWKMKFWTEPTSKHAFILSIISVVVTLVAAVIGIAFWKKFDSALCLVFGLENCVDLFSSIIVVWRFFAIGEVTKEREEVSMKMR